MENQVKKKLTISELIDNKEKFQTKNDIKEELYLDQLDATITIIKPERSLVMDTIEMANDKKFEGDSDDFFVYNIVVEPNLKDPELQKAYGCVEPVDIVSEIFDIGTISGIAKAGMKLGGYESNVTVVENLKN